MNREFLQN